MTEKPTPTVRQLRLVVEAEDFEAEDFDAAVGRLVAAGADLVAAATVTPWNSLNSRLEAPAGLQLTVFEEQARPST